MFPDAISCNDVREQQALAYSIMSTARASLVGRIDTDPLITNRLG